MELRGINHITFSVSDLNRSVKFYEHVLGARLLVKGSMLAYLDLNGLWVALNLETDVPRNEIRHSYTHIAFSIRDDDYEPFLQKLKELGVNILPGRQRKEEEKKSIYLTDPDGHRFEFHTGSLEDRLRYYRDNRPDLTWY